MWFNTVNILAVVGLALLVQGPPSCRKQPEPPLRQVSFGGEAQGTTFQVTYLSPDSISYQAETEALLDDIDRSLSLYRPGSLINRFNESRRGVIMDRFFRQVIEKALEVSRQSEGAFDVTVKPLVDAWGFGVERHSYVPDSSYIEELLEYVGYRLLEIKGDSLLKKLPEVQVDLNGIAQGYTLDVLGAFLESKHIGNYLVEVGGEIRAKGHNRKGIPWRIGIERPPEGGGRPVEGGPWQPLQQIISISGKGVSTSGNYRKFFESGGKHYAHTIDPRTGYPAPSGLVSVTVVAPDGITADAWDNALMVWGVDTSLERLKDHPALQAYFVYTDRAGELQDTSTAGFRDYFQEAGEREAPRGE